MSSWSRERRKRARERRSGDAKGKGPKPPRRKAGSGAEEEARPDETERERPAAPQREADDEVGSGESATFNCPKCGSDQTAKASAIFAAGTSTIETTSSHMGVAWAGGKSFIPAVGSSSTSGVKQTQLAAQLAPPGRYRTVGFFLIFVFLAGPILGVVALVLTFVLCILLAVVFDMFHDSADGLVATISYSLAVLVMLAVQARTVWLTVKMYRFNRDEWPGLHAEWEKKWYCGRCGETFVPDPNAVPTQPSPSLAPPEIPSVGGERDAARDPRGGEGAPAVRPDRSATAQSPEAVFLKLPDTPDELVSLIAGNMDAINSNDYDEIEEEKNLRIRMCGAALARLEFMATNRPELRATAERLRADYEQRMKAAKKSERIALVVGCGTLVALIVGVVFLVRGC